MNRLEIVGVLVLAVLLAVIILVIRDRRTPKVDGAPNGLLTDLFTIAAVVGSVLGFAGIVGLILFGLHYLMSLL